MENIEICDFGSSSNLANDGSYLIYDLKEDKRNEILAKVSEDPSIYEIEFFNTEQAAWNQEYAERAESPLEISRSPRTVYYSILNRETGCINVSSFDAVLFDTPTPVEIGSIELCDENEDGIIFNYNLSDLDSDILADQVNPGDFELNYYLSEEAAGFDINRLDKSNFNNSDSPFNKTIWIRLENVKNQQCAVITSFEFVVNIIPGINENLMPIIGCDDNRTGTYGFDLINLKYLIAEDENMHQFITYFETEQDAKNTVSNAGKIPDSLLENFEVTSRKVWARVFYNGCYKFVELDLQVHPLPEYNLPENLEFCNDGSSIDLSIQSQIIFQGIDKSENLTVTYHYSQEDAINGSNAISELRTDEIINGQMILFIRVENNVSGCVADYFEAFEIITNPLPEFEITSPIVFCDDAEEIDVFIDQEDSNNYNYVWIGPDGSTVNPINSRGTHVVLTKSGEYLIIGTNPETGCYTEKIYFAEVSEVAEVLPEHIIIEENFGSHSVQIRKDLIGNGIYLFAIDDPNGPYNDSGFFDDLSLGNHVIYIKDSLGCSTSQVEVTVLDFPKFFTPQQGANNRWNVRGILDNDKIPEFQNGEIDIFDRYGKYITTINIYEEGWDGTFKGALLLPTDYWYHAKFIDQNGSLREYQGHFSLIN
ncbi:T9SS type B sorting domain-containing protein [Flavobacteriaceae bacterium]|nr:T9SS type B sorting domain-containing protein [Flavobacteriaceae bacterium]